MVAVVAAAVTTALTTYENLHIDVDHGRQVKRFTFASAFDRLARISGCLAVCFTSSCKSMSSGSLTFYPVFLLQSSAHTERLLLYPDNVVFSIPAPLHGRLELQQEKI